MNISRNLNEESAGVEIIQILRHNYGGKVLDVNTAWSSDHT